MANNLITNARFQGWLAVIAFIAGIAMWYYGRDTKEITYTVSPSVTVAEKGANQKLRITWEGRDLANVVVRDVLIWNSGNTYIDRNDFSTTLPPVIVAADSGCYVLEAQLKSRSRKTLPLRFKPDRNRVYFTVAGDDGLEAGDYFVVRLLFTGDSAATWRVNGRIKGVNSDFNNVASEHYKTKRAKWNPTAIAINLGIALLLLAYLVFYLLPGLPERVSRFNTLVADKNYVGAAFWLITNIAIVSALLYFIFQILFKDYIVFAIPSL